MDVAQIQGKFENTKEKIRTLEKHLKKCTDTKDEIIMTGGQTVYELMITTYRSRLNELINERDGYLRQLYL